MNKFFVIMSAFALSGTALAQESIPAETAATESLNETVAPAEEPQQSEAPAVESTAEATPAVQNVTINVIAQPQSAPSYEGFNADAPTDVRQSAGEGNRDLPKPKRPTYNFQSIGLGVTIWHNWEDKKVNPKRDWDKGFNFHHGRIWEMGTFGAITLANNSQFSLGDHWQWSEVSRIGARVYFADAVFAPFMGGGIGLGIQLDGHYDDFSDMFAVGLAFGAEVGITIFRTSQTQLEIACSYDNVLDYLDWDRRFGAFNIYIAINY